MNSNPWGITRGVAIFGISCREASGADPAGLMRERAFTYGLLLDGDPVAEAFRVSAYPTFYILDDGGKILYRHVGVSDSFESEVTEVLEAYLKDRRP